MSGISKGIFASRALFFFFLKEVSSMTLMVGVAVNRVVSRCLILSLFMMN